VLRSFYAYAEIKIQAKQSTQFGKGHSFTPKKKREYVEKLTKLLVDSYDGPKILGSVRLSVIYCFPWRKQDFKSLGWVFKGTRLDLDNATKPLMDAIQDRMFGDDAQVVEMRARKIHTGWQGIAVRVDEVMPKREQKK
jgi:Holliday junction resolvase RusA-like endonuclease